MLELLQAELADARDRKQAEQLQLDLALAPKGATMTGAMLMAPAEEDDRMMAIRLAQDQLQSFLSSAAIDQWQASDIVNVGDHIYAQQLSSQSDAMTRKENLDHEFALALQRTDVGVDQDVEAVLGEARVRELMVSLRLIVLLLSKLTRCDRQTPEVVGKGKGKEVPLNLDELLNTVKGKTTAADVALSDPMMAFPVLLKQVPTDGLSTCGICLEATRIVTNPYKASTSATGSSTVPFGMYIGEESHKHVYCVNCLSRYITTKIDNVMVIAFPIECPDVSHPSPHSACLLDR